MPLSLAILFLNFISILVLIWCICFSKYFKALKKTPSNTKAAAKNEKPKKKEWTKEDDAARKIQTKYRQFTAKKNLEKKKKEKEEYEELMEKLEKEVLNFDENIFDVGYCFQLFLKIKFFFGFFKLRQIYSWNEINY